MYGSTKRTQFVDKYTFNRVVGHYTYYCNYYNIMTVCALRLLLLILAVTRVPPLHAFVPPHVVGSHRHDVGLDAATLTERQLQFWEDVDDGLRDIEDFWAKQGQDIARI
jgi:hypothetical protein